MGEEFSIFKNVNTLVVGSLKENTKVGKVDEADILLTINDEDLKKHIIFDRIDQRLKVRKSYWSGQRYSNFTKENLVRRKRRDNLSYSFNNNRISISSPG